MVDPNRVGAIAAAAGVVWDDASKFVQGHMAEVLTVDGDGFFHPCTCPIGLDHQALEPQANQGASEPPLYIPLPAVSVPDPTSDETYIDPAVPTDPTTQGL